MPIIISRTVIGFLFGTVISILSFYAIVPYKINFQVFENIITLISENISVPWHINLELLPQAQAFHCDLF